MNKEEQIQKLTEALSRLDGNQSVTYFLTYDTKNNPRAAVKHIYDMALTLNNNGFPSKILVEDKTYGGVPWLDDDYSKLEVVSIKEDRPEIKIEDTIVVPEYYSNVLQQLTNVKCNKVMLVQQKNYIFETLPVGSRWIDFGFDRVITTTEESKKYILQIFPEALVFIIPPIIGDNFTPSEKPTKPLVAINCRDRVIHKRLISEFYLKYPQLRFVTFRDMVQMNYKDFSDALKECVVSIWVDNESTFGTFPLESMKCEVPVIGKIPDTEPDWLSENGMWTDDTNKLVDILGTFMLSWLDGIDLTDEVKTKMKDTLLPYDTDVTKNNVLSIFGSIKNKRKEAIQKGIENLNKETI